MSIKYLLFVGICLGIATDIYAVDSTLKPGETSNAVIDATIKKIRTKCFLVQDNYFLRRLAEAQMKSTKNTTGGIWRVTEAQLTTVQNACTGILKTNCKKVQTEFNVDVSTLTMADLDIPLYSGLVMSLFILKLIPTIPLQEGDQARLWINYIYPNGSATEFLALSKKLEVLSNCASAQMDLVFLIDSSGSVGGRNFNETKKFLITVVNSLDINPKETRVAVVRFSSRPDIAFYLKTHSTKTEVIKAINDIRYNGGGTNTALALDKTRTSVFTDKRNSSTATKVLVLVTDGKSNNQAQTIAAAEKLKKDGVIIFTIGIANPNEIELTAAASDPSCIHFIRLNTYKETDLIVKEIESEACKAKYHVTNNTDLTGNSIPNSNATKEQGLDVTNTTQSNTCTIITVSVQCGVVIVYGAYNNSYPSSANYDYITNATDMKPGKIYAVKQTSASTFFMLIVSQKRFDLNISACNNPHYNISINATDPSIEVTCRQNNITIICATEDLKIVYDKGFKYPCTNETRQKGQYIFPYPNNPDKYFECDSAGKLTIVLCPGNQTFDAAQNKCRPVVPTLPGIPLKSHPCNDKPNVFHYPHPQHLSKFIQCNVVGHMYEMPCPANLYWYPEYQTCAHNPGGNVCGANTKDTFQAHPLSNSYFIMCVTDTNYEIRKCDHNEIWRQDLSKCV